MNQIAKAQLPNRNFKRLYWADNKEQIKEILSRVNIKYLEGLKKKFQRQIEELTELGFIFVTTDMNFRLVLLL